MRLHLQLESAAAPPSCLRTERPLTCVQQHVSVEASLEGEASAALSAVEGLLCARPVDRHVGFELQQLGEGLPAQFAAQRLLHDLLIHSTVFRGFHNALRSGGASRVLLVQLIKTLYPLINYVFSHSSLDQDKLKPRQRLIVCVHYLFL